MNASQELTDIRKSLQRIELYTQLNAKEIYTVEEASLYTGLNKHTIYRLTCSRGIPHYKVGRTLRFKRSELDEWMTRERITTQQELNQQAATYMVFKDKGYTQK